MKKIITMIALGVVAVLQLNAQSISKQVIASTGSSTNAGAYQIEQTIGEAMVTTQTESEYILCQGFQQANGKTTVAIEELDNYKLTYYPNPVQDNLHITLENEEDAIRLSLYNALGQKVQEKSYQNQQELLLNMQTLDAGIYFIQINIQGKTIQFELLKK